MGLRIGPGFRQVALTGPGPPCYGANAVYEDFLRRAYGDPYGRLPGRLAVIRGEDRPGD